MVQKVPFIDFGPALAPIRESLMEAFAQFIDSRHYVLGPQTSAFESAYADYTGSAFCTGVSSGMSALHLCLKALGIGPGDEVIVPSNTYIATWLAVSYVQAGIVPVEPDPVTRNIDPLRIEAAITPRTKAILPVHLYGLPCDMPAITALGQKHQLLIIEDNAQAQGAEISGKRTGSWGHINAHSFYPTKNLGAFGEAGAVTTDVPQLDEQIRLLRNYGSATKYINEVIGYNYRMDECQAAMLRIKLQHLDNWNAARRQLADGYRQRLSGILGLYLPAEPADCMPVYHLFVVQCEAREPLQHYLAQRGIQTLVHYPVPPHLQEAYRYLGFQNGDFPVAEYLSRTALSLPLYPGLEERQLDYVCEAIREFFRKGS